MKKAFIIMALLALSGCISVSSPLNNINEIDTSDIDKEGVACSYKVFGLIGPFGDNSMIRAAKNGGISRVLYYDISKENYLLFTRRCNRTYGY